MTSTETAKSPPKTSESCFPTFRSFHVSAKNRAALPGTPPYRPYQISSGDYKDRVEAQEEIDLIIQSLFGENNSIGFEEFKEHNQCKQSDTLICVCAPFC